MRHFIVADNKSLLEFLFSALGQKRSAVKNLLKFGAVQVNGAITHQFDHPLQAGDVVTVGSLRSAVASRQLDQRRIQIVYEDDAIVAVDKPAGLLTVAADRKGQNQDTLYQRLNRFLRTRNPRAKERVTVVHRLDRETSGLVLLAKTNAVKEILQQDWPNIRKIYVAVVHGVPQCASGRIESYLSENPKSLNVFSSDRPSPNARLAISHYRILETRGIRSLIQIELDTGRKHQIRVHLADLGCPVVGDRRYGRRGDDAGRLALHASEMHLLHPLTGEKLHFSSPLPEALQRLVS